MIVEYNRNNHWTRNDGRVSEEQPLRQYMMIEYKITTILSVADDRVQEEHRIGQKMMVEYNRNNHYARR